MKFGKGEDCNNMADILVKYDQHFLGQKQEFFERLQFNRHNQESGASIDEYVSVLRNLTKTCGFCDCMHELLPMDRLLLGISDDKTPEELLSTHDLTLTKTIEICCAKEAASLHMKALKSEEINKVTHNPNKKKKSGDSKHKTKENLKIMEKEQTNKQTNTLFHISLLHDKKEEIKREESAMERKILVKENLEKLVIRVLLKESVSSAPKFTY